MTAAADSAGRGRGDPEWTYPHYDEPPEEDEYDPGDECGRWDNGRLTGSCQLAGTEFCDWECPYS